MPTRVLAFVSAVVVASLGAVLGLVARSPHIDVSLLGGAVSFAVLGVVAHFVGYRLQGSTFGAISFIPFLTAVILYPSWPTVLLVLLAVTVSEFNRKKQAIKRVFNVAQQTLAASTAVLVFSLMGGVSLQQDETLRPLPEAAAVVAFLLVNSFLVAAVVALSERKNLFRVWQRNVSSSLAYDVMAIPFIHAFALVFTHFDYVGVLFVLMLLFGVRQLYHTNTQLVKYNRELLEVLVHTVEMRDQYTSGHSQRVARYSRIIARSLGLPAKQVERIGVAALLHDVGKIHEIFAPILSKPGKLTSEERAIMELHPIKSVELVEKVSELEDILPAIRHHHENWNGTGYPDRLSGKQIPLGARIITFADTIDAMTTDRPYRKALSELEVRSEILRMRAIQFDPDICDALLASPAYSLIFSGEESRGTPSITQIFDLTRKRRTPVVV